MANGHGGSRPGTGGRRAGAGRKKGATTQRTQKTNALAEKAAGEGPLPLQVMLEAMRSYHAAGQPDKAAAIAKDAAPYVHRRKAALTIEGGEQPLEIKLTRDHDFYRNVDRLPAAGA
jgi:hypothetical protein